jgi:hypothetical protein
MSARIVCAALAACCLAAPLAAQGTPPTTQTPPQVPPQTAPQVPPAAAPADSGGSEGGAPLELRLAGFTNMSTRTTATATTANASTSPSMMGAEFALRSLNGGGLFVRFSEGTLSPAPTLVKMSFLDGRLELGGRTVVLELGYLLKSENDGGVLTQTGYARAGFRTAFHFGSSGVVAEMEASYFRDPTQEKSGITGSGITGESSVLYTPPKLPFYLQLGYRRDAWAYTYTGTPVGAITAEEWSTVFLGVGFQLGLP